MVCRIRNFCHLARLLCLFTVLPLLISPSAGSAEEVPVPALTQRVTDLSNTLRPEEKTLLERELQDFETRKGAQIALLIVATTGDETIEQYGIRVAENWKLGRKGVDDGVLLLIAKNDRKLRIEVGYGLEGALSDIISKRIISDIITPRFKQGDYFGGIRDGLQAIMKVIDGEALPEPKGSTAGSSNDSFTPLVIFLFFLMIGATQLLRSLTGSIGASGIMAGVGWLVALIMGAGFLLSLLIALLVFILSFFGAYLPISSGSYGGGSWSSGGGGFSGGGGSFGGGGSSGSW